MILSEINPTNLFAVKAMEAETIISQIPQFSSKESMTIDLFLDLNRGTIDYDVAIDNKMLLGLCLQLIDRDFFHICFNVAMAVGKKCCRRWGSKSH